jgi:hypothetical protein
LLTLTLVVWLLVLLASPVEASPAPVLPVIVAFPETAV